MFFFFLIILNYNVNNVYNNIIVFEEIGTRDVAMAVPVPGTCCIIVPYNYLGININTASALCPLLSDLRRKKKRLNSEEVVLF